LIMKVMTVSLSREGEGRFVSRVRDFHSNLKCNT
jgi:hypothetical protein